VSITTVSLYVHADYSAAVSHSTKVSTIMLFRIGEKEYSGQSALDIIQALQLDTLDGQRMNPRDFLRWSLSQLSDLIPLRELDVSDTLSNETLALHYLYLRDEYGAGQLSDLPSRD
jgi:hypothetical protein